MTLGAWLVGVALTGAVVRGVRLDLGTDNSAAHLVLNTVDACVALLVAYLLHGRFTRDRDRPHLLLVQGFVLLAVAGLGLGPAVLAAGHAASGTVDVWVPWAVRLVGAVVISVAAFAPGRPVRTKAQWCPQLAGPAVIVAVLCAVLWAASGRLPSAIEDVSADGTWHLLSGHPILLAGQAVSAAGFLTASLAFTRQGARGGDPLVVWLGPACALAGFSRIHYMLFPSLYSDQLYTGDFLRTSCYLLLAVGAAREMRHYWSAQARAAVLDDRRRLARELHDGVVQELAFIRAESYSVPEDSPSRSRIVAACDRALDEARAAIQALGRPSDEPLGFMLHRAARELAERYNIELEVDVDDSITARADQKHALLRIAREAVSNAVRHGKAQRLCLTLSRDGASQRLTIRDDGRGFDAGRAGSAPGGYGLTSMRDRAHSLPGSFDVRAQHGAGTQVTVTW